MACICFQQVVLVTGGGTGIGRMIAQGFVDNGARVYIASRKEASKAAADIVRASLHPSGACVVCVVVVCGCGVWICDETTDEDSFIARGHLLGLHAAFCQGLTADLADQGDQQRVLDVIAKV